MEGNGRGVGNRRDRGRIRGGGGAGMGGIRARGGIQQTGQTVICTVFDKNTIVYDRIRRKYGRIRR